MSPGTPEGRRAGVACPYLRLAADHASRTAYPTDAHHCLRTGPPSEVGLQHQAVFCLTGRFGECSRYLARTGGRGVRRATVLGVASIVGASAAALAVVVFAVGNPLTVEPEPPTAGSIANVLASVTATPASAAVTATSLTAASPAPTPSAPGTVPSPTSTPETAGDFSGSYVTQPGDSLTSVARRYGTAVAALAAANGLSPNAQLQTGQRLRVPASTPVPTPGR